MKWYWDSLINIAETTTRPTKKKSVRELDRGKSNEKTIRFKKKSPRKPSATVRSCPVVLFSAAAAAMATSKVGQRKTIFGSARSVTHSTVPCGLVAALGGGLT